MPCKRLLLITVLIALALPACGGGSSQEQKELTRKLDELGSDIRHIQEEVAVFGAVAKDLEERLEEVEGVTGLVLDTSRVGPDRAKFLPDPPSGKVTVQLLALDINDAIPGEFTFHLAAPEASRLFTTESIPAGQTFPVGQELEKGIAFVEPGKFYTLQVVYRNPTDEEIKFLVDSPTLDPQAALPFARARCWCAAVQFSAPPEGAFFRTIQVGVGPDTPPGAKAIVVWPVIRLSE